MKASFKYILIPCVLCCLYGLYKLICYHISIYWYHKASSFMLMEYLSLIPSIIIPCWLFCTIYQLALFNKRNGVYLLVLLLALILQDSLNLQDISLYRMPLLMYLIGKLLSSMSSILIIAIISLYYAKLYKLEAYASVNSYFVCMAYTSLICCAMWALLKPFQFVIYGGCVDISGFFIVCILILATFFAYFYYWAKAQLGLLKIPVNYPIKIIIAFFISFTVFFLCMVLQGFFIYTMLSDLTINKSFKWMRFYGLIYCMISYGVGIYLLINLQTKASAIAYKVIYCGFCYVFPILLVIFAILSGVMRLYETLVLFGLFLGLLAVSLWIAYLRNKLALYLTFK